MLSSPFEEGAEAANGGSVLSDIVRQRLQALLPGLFGYARSLTGSDEAARDLVQECALRALATKSRPDDESALKAWLFAIARNALIDSYRRDQQRPTGPADDAVDDVVDWTEGDRFIDAITVRQGIATLSVDQREIIALVDIAGFTYAESAELLGVPIGTVMSRLSRARRALLAAIREGTVRPFLSRRWKR